MIAVCRNQIKKWSQIKAGDADGYRRFQNFLIKCDNINQLQAWNILDSPDIICMLVSRLPGSARDRWSRKVLGIRRDKGREPDMKYFIYFVNDETVIVSDPIFSKQAVEQYLEKKQNYSNRKGRLSTFATGNKEESKV